MLTPLTSSQFKRDADRAKRRGKDMAKLSAIMTRLIEERPLTQREADHPLKGAWRGYRDCHIEGDWVLIYKKTGTEILFERTGSHADLFEQKKGRR
jgi:mRNA interferase YafQ